MIFAGTRIVQHLELWVCAAARAPDPGLSSSVSLSLHLLSLSYTHTEIQAHSDLRPLLIWGKNSSLCSPTGQESIRPPPGHFALFAE